MSYLALLLTKYGYFILFPLAAFEGPVISLIAGFLIRLGYFEILPAYAILILGDLIPDVTYYYIGRFGNRKKLVEKYGAKYNFISSNFKLVERLWEEHGRKTMFFGKLAYGLATPFLISAGLTNMPLKRFVSYALPVTFFQYAVIMAIGYYLGSSYQLATHYIKNIEIFIAIIFIILIVIYVFISKYARKQIDKMEYIEKIEHKEL